MPTTDTSKPPVHLDAQDVPALLAAGVAGTIPNLVGDTGTADERAVFVIPDGYGLREVDVVPEKAQDYPRQPRGDRHVTTLDSLADLLDKHATAETEVFADSTSGRITAVLDGGSPANRDAKIPGTGSWFDHRVILTARRTDEWAAWKKIDGELLDQATFAEWLEQHAHVVQEPSYADLLEVAQSIEVTQGGTFRSAIRTSSGQRTFVLDEQQSAAAGVDGGLEVPVELSALLAPWEGTDPVPVRVLFRHRLQGGSLKLGIRIVRSDEVERAGWDGLVQRVRLWLDDYEDLQGLRVVLGTPPSPRR